MKSCHSVAFVLDCAVYATLGYKKGHNFKGTLLACTVECIATIPVRVACVGITLLDKELKYLRMSSF